MLNTYDSPRPAKVSLTPGLAPVLAKRQFLELQARYRGLAFGMGRGGQRWIFPETNRAEVSGPHTFRDPLPGPST